MLNIQWKSRRALLTFCLFICFDYELTDEWIPGTGRGRGWTAGSELWLQFIARPAEVRLPTAASSAGTGGHHLRQSSSCRHGQLATLWHTVPCIQRDLFLRVPQILKTFVIWFVIIIPGGNALHLFPFMCHFLDTKPSDVWQENWAGWQGLRTRE